MGNLVETIKVNADTSLLVTDEGNNNFNITRSDTGNMLETVEGEEMAIKIASFISSELAWALEA